MKVALLGAAGARAPLLLRALQSSGLPLDTLALYDIDRARLALVRRLAERYEGPAALVVADRTEDAVEGADFVLASLRAGGMEPRARDEEACLELGVLGQETVGPAGFAMALRNVPPTVGYGRLVARLAPDALLVNYTNPVGIVTQAVADETGARVVGICDTPTELFAAVAEVLDLPIGSCRFDYVGLNHLGWLREAYHGDEPLLARVLADDEKLRRVYRAELFPPSFLRELGLLPTEYLYFYYRTAEALETLRTAGRTRGRALVEANEALFEALATAPDPQAVYDRYVVERDRSYFALETGGTARPEWGFEATGYDKIALDLMRAVAFDTGAVLPLNVANDGLFADLAPGDVVEVPTRAARDGLRPLPTSIPDAGRELILRVKDYERATIAAALRPSHERRLAALLRHPFVSDRDLGERLLERLALPGATE